jgi:WD40 repeat protein
MHFLITIDSENLLRGWSTRESMTKLSYRIPV